MDQLCLKTSFFQVLFHAQVKTWVVDEDGRAGVHSKDLFAYKIKVLDKSWKGAKDIEKTHYLKFFHRKDAVDTKRSHPRACNRCDLKGRVFLSYLLDERLPMQISTWLSRKNKDVVIHTRFQRCKSQHAPSSKTAFEVPCP